MSEIAKAVGVVLDKDQSDPLGILNHALKERELRVVFLFDGLEEIFSDFATSPARQTALKALINLPKKISELRHSNLGLIIFLRHDLPRYATPQNQARFENLYRPYELAWNKESFLKLVFWICGQAGVIGAKVDDIDRLSPEDISEHLKKLWGAKLGSDTSGEAYAVRWIFAALTDYKGMLQARDIIRFLLNAAAITMDRSKVVEFEKWAKTRLLPPKAVHQALEPCGKKKVMEAEEEYPKFKEWVKTISSGCTADQRQIPLTPENPGMDRSTVATLEEMGVIYEDRAKNGVTKYYMPDLYRVGLNFKLDRAARTHVETQGVGTRILTTDLVNLLDIERQIPQIGRFPISSLDSPVKCSNLNFANQNISPANLNENGMISSCYV